jgi:molybdate transport system substrate-binding protein
MPAMDGGHPAGPQCWMIQRSVLICLAVLLGALPARGQDTRLQDTRLQDAPVSAAVFAAASVKNALDDIIAAYGRNTGRKVVASYAASSALVKQIEEGAPADVFISADQDWMDYAAQKKLIVPKSRFNLLGNRLVLIAPKDAKLDEVKIGPGFDIGKLAGDGRIATGDVRAVPAGKYAKAALEKLGSWSAAEPKLAPSESVRAALALVAHGGATLGIVYETDARVEPEVKIVGRFPDNSHPPIVYPAAQTVMARPDASKFFTFLLSGTALVFFERHGFTYLVKAGP